MRIAIDQRRLGSAHGVRAVSRGIEADFLDPVMHDPGVLPRAEVRLGYGGYVEALLPRMPA
jgi:hypothetical protein